MELWATWAGERCLYPWKRVGTGCALGSLPTQPFCGSVNTQCFPNIWTGQLKNSLFKIFKFIKYLDGIFSYMENMVSSVKSLSEAFPIHGRFYKVTKCKLSQTKPSDQVKF